MKVLNFKGHYSGEYTFSREMREKAASYLLNNIVQAVLLLSGIIEYAVLIYQIDSSQEYQGTLSATTGVKPQCIIVEKMRLFSAHKQKASLVAIDLMRTY